MPEFTLECEGDAREVYHVIAEDEDEARAMFERGQLGPADVTECSTAIVSITEEPNT